MGTEYVGVLVALAVIVLTLLAVAGPSGAALTAKTASVICRIVPAVGPGDCAEPTGRPRQTGPSTITARTDAADGLGAGPRFTAKTFSASTLGPRPRESYRDGGVTRVADWCSIYAEPVGADGFTTQHAVCATANGPRTCTRRWRGSPGDLPYDCTQGSIDPNAVNCLPNGRDCTLADARSYDGPEGFHWLRCTTIADPAPDEVAGDLACAPSQRPVAGYVRDCSEDWRALDGPGRSIRYTRQVLCVDDHGLAVACRGTTTNPLDCSPWLAAGSLTCGTPTLDGRALCVVQDGTAPHPCTPRDRTPDGCQDVRLFECTMIGDAPHDCVERTPRKGDHGSRSASICTDWVRHRRRPKADGPGFCSVVEPGARSVGESIDERGRLKDVYTSGSGVRLAKDRDLADVVEHAEAIRQAMRCAYGVDGVDAKGHGAQVVLLPDPRDGHGGVVPRATESDVATGAIRVHGPNNAGALAVGLGRTLIGPAGLVAFDHQGFVGGEPEAVEEGFAWINAQVANDHLARGAGSWELGLELGRARDFSGRVPYDTPAWEVASTLAQGTLAPAIYTDLEALARSSPSLGAAASIPYGCDPGKKDPLARWWFATLETFKSDPNPTFVQWCEAQIRTGARFRITPQAVAAVFQAHGVPCGPPRRRTVDVRRPKLPDLVGASISGALQAPLLGSNP